jgi:hypothetical protein
MLANCEILSHLPCNNLDEFMSNEYRRCSSPCWANPEIFASENLTVFEKVFRLDSEETRSRTGVGVMDSCVPDPKVTKVDDRLASFWYLFLRWVLVPIFSTSFWYQKSWHICAVSGADLHWRQGIIVQAWQSVEDEEDEMFAVRLP